MTLKDVETKKTKEEKKEDKSTTGYTERNVSQLDVLLGVFIVMILSPILFRVIPVIIKTLAKALGL